MASIGVGGRVPKLCHFGPRPPISWAVLKKNYRAGFKRVTWVRIRHVIDPEANRNDLGIPPHFHLPVVVRLSVCASSPLLAEHQTLAAVQPAMPLPTPCSPQGASRPCPASPCWLGGDHIISSGLLLEQRPLIRAAQPAPMSISGARELGC